VAAQLASKRSPSWLGVAGSAVAKYFPTPDNGLADLVARTQTVLDRAVGTCEGLTAVHRRNTKSLVRQSIARNHRGE
jgi:hypothetical protein